MPELKGKVAIITGSSSGIGKAIAIEFAKLGALVSLTGRNEENLDKTKQLCLEAGLKDEQVLATVADVTKEEDLKKLVDGTLGKFGKLDILVNNAGISAPDNSVNASIDTYDNVMNTNMRSVLILTQLCLDALKASKGSIINISSVASLKYSPMHLYYGMSKAALDYFAKCLSLELAPHGVRVNNVNPAAIDTPIFDKVVGSGEGKKNLLHMLAGMHPLGRIGEPSEVAKSVAFLASDDASFTTGHVFVVDGGMATGMGMNPQIMQQFQRMRSK